MELHVFCSTYNLICSALIIRRQHMKVSRPLKWLRKTVYNTVMLSSNFRWTDWIFLVWQCMMHFLYFFFLNPQIISTKKKLVRTLKVYRPTILVPQNQRCGQPVNLTRQPDCRVDIYSAVDQMFGEYRGRFFEVIIFHQTSTTIKYYVHKQICCSINIIV